MSAETVLSIHDADAPSIERLRTRPEAPTLEPLAVGREQLAALLTIGVATLDRWDAAGLLGPLGVRKAGRKLWSLAELRDWAAAGMPCRKEWLARRAAAANASVRPR
jgi:hypothetical protein